MIQTFRSDQFQGSRAATARIVARFVSTVFVNIKPRKRNAPRPAWKVATSYLQWLRGRRCAVENTHCGGKIEAAHTPDPDSKGMGTKAADYTAVPLCSEHHRQQHQMGWDSFAKMHGIKNITEWRSAFWRAWPGWKAWSLDK